MVDREDIDALLIGALYGELTPAEEARLQAHLASHPADRMALADLTATRTQLHDNRILQVQAEPPGSVSALLLQEAARRAPRRAREHGEGWFARFVGSFMMHPAMAAAAMLVVVVGAAALISSRGGAGRPELAEPSVSLSSEAPASAPPPAPAQGAAAGSAMAASPPPTEQYPVALDEGLADPTANREGASAPTRKPSTTSGLVSGAGTGGGAAAETKGQAPVADARSKADAAGPRGGIELRAPAAMPKDFDDGDDYDKAPAPADSAGAKKERALIGAARPEPSQQYAPPPPPVAAPTPAKSAPAAPAARQDEAVVDKKLAWARKQHEAAVAAARANRCTDAAALAFAISTQVPAYYEQNVASDRALKSCATYIAAERKAAEARESAAKAAADTK